MSLIEWQQHFSSSLADNKYNDTNSYERMNVYKESIEAIHLNALKISFPVTLQLLGESNFRQLSRLYIREKRWSTTRLDDFGYDLEQFVTKCRQLEAMSYLSSVVSLEWLIQSLPCEEDLSDSTATAIKLNDASNDTSIGLGLSKHVECYIDQHSAVEIWQAHQSNQIEQGVEISEQTNWYLVGRHKEGVRFKRISENQYSIIGGIRQSKMLSGLVDQL